MFVFGEQFPDNASKSITLLGKITDQVWIDDVLVVPPRRFETEELGLIFDSGKL